MATTYSSRAERADLRGDGVRLAADVWQPPGRHRGTVVLLHGGGQTRHSWRRTGDRLATRGWRTYAVDLRGHGDSDWSADGDYRPGVHARDLATLTAELGEKPVLVGASLGGMAALLAQGADPTLAAALVLVDITPRSEAAGVAKITGFMRRGLAGFDSLDEALAAVVAYNPHRRRPPRREGLRKNLRHRDGRWYWHWDPQLLAHRTTSAAASADLEARARAAARSVDVPTLLIRGAQSDVVGPDGVQDLLDLIPTARHIEVHGAGHMVSGDDNDLLCHGLIEFLDDAVAPRL